MVGFAHGLAYLVEASWLFSGQDRQTRGFTTYGYRNIPSLVYFGSVFLVSCSGRDLWDSVPNRSLKSDLVLV